MVKSRRVNLNRDEASPADEYEIFTPSDAPEGMQNGSPEIWQLMSPSKT